MSELWYVETSLINLTPDANSSLMKWMDEVKRLCPSVPAILVGLKADLRDNRIVRESMRMNPLRFVTQEEGEACAREMGAECYLECSALTSRGINEVFEVAARATLTTTEKKNHRACCVML